MKKVKFWQPIIAVLLGLSASIAGSYPAIQSIKAEREMTKAEIVELNHQLHNALLHRDFPALQALLADDFEIHVGSDLVLSKQEWIKNIQKKNANYSEIQELSNFDFQGNQFTSLSNVSGEFCGVESASLVEATITTVERKDKRQIKRLIIKKLA
ncbi:nuclear transport factor 2 family protein [Glaesserella sp.]|uniref:nuclear transport factor 2 family protein n=1 Tax=Glaesserella sp. TaxID=2094731 RepID=UPI0035A0BF34